MASTPIPLPTPRPPRQAGRACARWRAGLALLPGLLAGAGVAAPGQGVVAGQAAGLVSSAPSPLPGAQLRLALGRSASMVYEPRRLAAPQPLADPLAGGARPSLGLEFRAPPSSRDGPRALLRVQLSGDAALQFRPRRGGLAVSYQAEF